MTLYINKDAYFWALQKMTALNFNVSILFAVSYEKKYRRKNIEKYLTISYLYINKKSRKRISKPSNKQKGVRDAV